MLIMFTMQRILNKRAQLNGEQIHESVSKNDIQRQPKVALPKMAMSRYLSYMIWFTP